MTIDALTAAPVTPTTADLASSATDSAASTITADFEAFLKMLTVQLQNQDPLNPAEATDFAVQLATFSNVEQQVQTNDLLRDLTEVMTAGGLTQLAGWVGREVRAPVGAVFDGNPVTVIPTIDSAATEAELVVIDEDGTEVQRLPLSLNATSYTWEGYDDTGALFPNGTYSFAVATYENDLFLNEQTADVYTRVTEVRTGNGTPEVVTASGEAVPSSDITALRDPQT